MSIQKRLAGGATKGELSRARSFGSVSGSMPRGSLSAGAKTVRRGGAKVSIIITGDKKLNRMLAALTSNEAKKIIREAARPALKRLLPRVKIATPYRTGLLRKSIKVTAIRRSRKRFGYRLGTGARNQAQWAGKTFYGAFIEFGTKRIKAWHMVEGTTERHKERILRFYRYLIKMGLENLAKRTP